MTHFRCNKNVVKQVNLTNRIKNYYYPFIRSIGYNPQSLNIKYVYHQKLLLIFYVLFYSFFSDFIKHGQGRIGIVIWLG